jgi:putative CocE/NonD family hydrolase
MALTHSTRLRLALVAGTVLTIGAGTLAAAAPASHRPATVAAAATAAKHHKGNGAPKVESAPASLIGLSPTLPKSVVRATSAKHSWRPEKAIYGTGSRNDLVVKGVGGTPIRVNEIYPTTKNGKPAKGRFPVVMTMTPYGKGTGGSSKPGSAQKPGGGSATGGADNYLVQRGYINVVEDVRGTGDSNGSWGLFDPIQQRDAVKVLHWAARLKHSDGRVGTYGPSYLGIDQMLLAGTVGRHSPLKAIFPMVPANDSFRDTAFMGGLLDFEFSEAYLGLTGGLNAVNPVEDSTSDSKLLKDLLSIEADHANGIAKYHAGITAKILEDKSEAYDEKYWKARAPQTMIHRIIRNRIPAFLVGGEFDIFQHGEPINFAELQNGWDHRSVTAAMRPHQRVTGRYQLIDGPWEHLNGSSVDVDPLELEWFDTWLKHEHTGMAHTKTPLHYYDLGTGKFHETTTYPFTGARPHRLYLRNGKTLSRHKPRKAGSNTVDWSPSGNPCGRPIDQWVMGGISIPSHIAGLMAPCADNDKSSQVGPDTVSFTTKPFAHARTLAGPIAARLYATATTKETEWVTEVEMVTRTGASYPLTEGALLGSLRAVDAKRSWRSHGVTVLPYHRYTKASQHAVKVGKLTRYDIEIFPTLATIPRGDSLRVTISTADTPHLVPVPKQLAKLVGGIYKIKHSRRAPSALIVELRKP